MDHLKTHTQRRRVFALAWPVIAENFLETSLGIVDTILVAGLGVGAIAGVGTAIQVLFFIMAVLSALSVGSAVLVAQAFGAGRLERASDLARQSLLWSIVFSVPLALIGLFLSGPIVSLFGLEPAVANIAEGYLKITTCTAVVMTARFLIGGVFRGVGDSRTPMLVTAGANVINVGLSYILIYGHLGAPALGAEGSAWGTLVARAMALSVLILLLWRGRHGVSLKGTTPLRLDGAIARQVLKIGIPAAMEQILITCGFSLLTILVAHLGTPTLGAHRIAMNAMSVSFMPGFGFSMAATALVGQSIGRKKPDEGRIIARIATLWGVLWMGGIGLVILLTAPYVMRIFTQDQQVIDVGAAGLQIVAIAQPFWAIIFIQSGAIRGTGNTSFPLRINATSIWLSVGLAYLFTYWFGETLAVIWTAFMFTAPLASLFLIWKFRKIIHKAIGEAQ